MSDVEKDPSPDRHLYAGFMDQFKEKPVSTLVDQARKVIAALDFVFRDGNVEAVQSAQELIRQLADRVQELEGKGETVDRFDEVLQPFMALMRKELHANTGKGDRPGWLQMDANTALLEVYHHLAKLQKAVRNNDGPGIVEYAADVANMAMMVLDVCGGLPGCTASQPSSVQPEKEERMTLSDAILVQCIKRAGFRTWDSRMWALKREIEAAHGISPSPSMVGREGE
jgi:ABC-type transporter Mla subunit MlaD